LGAAAKPIRWMVQPSLVLGRASYGIYVLHAPFAQLWRQIWIHVRGHSIEHDSPWSGLALVVGIIFFVLMLDRFYDVPARRWLADKLHLTRAHVDARSTLVV